jgi:hypothetical protein
MNMIGLARQANTIRANIFFQLQGQGLVVRGGTPEAIHCLFHIPQHLTVIQLGVDAITENKAGA